MADWLPESLRQPLRRLREDIHSALERWRQRRTETENDGETHHTGWRSAGMGNLLSPWPGRAIDEDWTAPLGSTDGIRVDVKESDNEVVVLAELPGLNEDDFTVEVTGDRLVLRGEKRHESEENRPGYYYAERHYGAFTRVIALPSEVDPKKAKAKYKHGVLRITLPKTAHAKAKRITVRAQ